MSIYGPKLTVTTTETRYHIAIKRGGITETVHTDGHMEFEFRPPWEGASEYYNVPWLHATRGPHSLPMHERHRHETCAKGWVCQGGMKPVYDAGRWGGRNYPEIKIAPDDMQCIWDWYDALLYAENAGQTTQAQ